MLKPLMRTQRGPLRPRRRSQQGYILITLTLFVALLAVAAMAIAPSIIFQVKRDREEELIHRGTQYSRAIRAYFKKFGRYPVSLNDLENTNNLRFLRKRYKDPITGKDFKLLHFGEAQMMGMGGGVAGATPVSAMASETTATNTNPSQGFSLGTAGTQTSSGQTQPGQDSSGTASSDQNSPGGSPPIVGGPIVGVISISKEKSIRAFGGKDRYNQWQFIYDPALELNGGLIKTPSQPLLQGVVPNVNGQPQGALGPGSSSPGPGTATQTPTQSPSTSPVSTPNMPPEQ